MSGSGEFRSYLIDVDVLPIKGKPYSSVRVPLPEAGTYTDGHGVTRAMMGRIFVSNDEITINKTQPHLDRTLGVVRLIPNKPYDVEYKRLANDSIHADFESAHHYFTGRELRQYNEKYGEPASKRAEKAREEELAKTLPGAQMSLFDDYLPGKDVSFLPENEKIDNDSSFQLQ